jgi:hypothetical protein
VLLEDNQNIETSSTDFVIHLLHFLHGVNFNKIIKCNYKLQDISKLFCKLQSLQDISGSDCFYRKIKNWNK